MKYKFNHFTVVMLLLVFYAAGLAKPTDHGIVIAGGDKNPEVTKWREETADEFRDLLIARGVKKDSISEPRTERQIRDAIRGLKGKVKCGDNIIIYFNGHGSQAGSLIVGRNSVSTSEVLKWLKEARLPCCCKIHLVIHACYSGNFVKKVMQGNKHVITGASSSKDTRKAHKDVKRNATTGELTLHGRDWPTGFNHDLKLVPKDKSWTEAIEIARISAKEKMRGKWKKEDGPMTWRRFQGHVEAVVLEKPGGPKSVKIKDKDGEIRTVTLKPTRKIRVGDVDLKYCELRDSSDVDAVCLLGPDGKYEVKYIEADLNLKGAWGHVQSVNRTKGTFKVHFEAPSFLRCKTKTVKMKKGSPLPDWVRFCKWVEVKEGQLGKEIEVGSIAERESPQVKFKGHIEAVNREKGEVIVYLNSPSWMAGRLKTIKIPAGKIPTWMKYCNWVEFSGKLGDFITDVTRFKRIKTPRQSFKGHVRAVDRDKKTMTVHLNFPAGMFCQTTTVTDVPDKLLNKFVPCNWVFFQGHLTPEGIKLWTKSGPGMSGTRPITRNFEGHVKRINGKEIEVELTAPEQLKGKIRTLRLKSGEKFPEHIKVCNRISANGYLISDTVVLVNRIVKLLARRDRDAGIQRRVKPGSRALAQTSIRPEALIRNFGEQSLANIPIFCHIDSAGLGIYSDSVTIPNLQPGEELSMAFSPWQSGAAGASYQVTFSIVMPGDQDPGNNVISVPVTTYQAVQQDNTPPQVQIIMPAEGDTVPGQVLINADVFDEQDPQPVVEFLVNGNLLERTTRQPYSHLWDASRASPNVEHLVEVRAIDNSGNVNQDQVVVVTEPAPLQPNQPPVLADGTVQPGSGDENTPFTFSVTYTDPDGDLPVLSQVVVDAIPIDLTPVGGTPEAGMVFDCEIPLSEGEHHYYFRFDDGHGHVIETSNAQGPQVQGQ